MYAKLLSSEVLFLAQNAPQTIRRLCSAQIEREGLEHKGELKTNFDSRFGG